MTLYQSKPIGSTGNEKKGKVGNYLVSLVLLETWSNISKISWYFVMELKQEAHHIDADVVGIATCHFKQEDISYSFLCVYVYKESF